MCLTPLQQHAITISTIKHIENRWVYHLFNQLGEFEIPIPKLEAWEEAYLKLLTAQEARGMHPIHEDNPDVFWQVANDFYKIFSKCP